MFPLTTKTTAFPESEKIAKLALESIIENHDLEWEQAHQDGFEPEEFNRLRKAWKNFEGPVHDSSHFGVAVLLDDEEELYAFAEYKNGDVRCSLVPEDELPLRLLKVVEFHGQIFAERKVRPNDKCPCGKKDIAGKSIKFKRCCGRLQ